MLSNKIAKANAFRNQTTKNKSTYEKEGFVFLFEDEVLQDEYISEYRKFNKLFVEKGKVSLPKPNKITYQDARSLVSGKNQQQLVELQNIYDQQDYNWEAKGNMHKRHLFQEAVKENNGSQEMSHFIKSAQKLTDELAEATKVRDIEGVSQVKYNIVYYTRQQA